MAVTIPSSDTALRATEFEFVIGGMTCAACAARVQAKLNKLDGVTAAVNLATERARVIVPPGVTEGQLISAVESVGYTAELAAPGDEAAQQDAVAVHDATVRRLRRRLVLALVFFVPLTDLSIVQSLFPWSRFPGWQWVLVALAAPVATWAAWPFHQAALKNARHLSSSMDTLVSLGILAACGWSVYAMFVLDRSRTGLAGLQAVIHASGGGIYLEVAASVTTFLLAGLLTRHGPGAPPGRRCAIWPRPAPGTSASWPTTTPSSRSRPPGSRSANASSSAQGSGSPPTARSCPASPPSTAA